MKKIISLFIVAILLVIAFIPTSYAYTTHPIDEILSFEIYAKPRSDATIDFTYHIKWKVLDLDEDNNGVTWVKIGVPNKYTDSVTPLSNDIKKAYYKSFDNNTYIRVDLVKEFVNDEIIDIKFSFHQSHMFTYMNDEATKMVTFLYTPGWFDDIRVDNLTLYWDISGVSETDLFYRYFTRQEGNYLVREEVLNQGERIKIEIAYDEKIFPNIDPKAEYNGSKDYRETNMYVLVMIIIFVILTVIFVLYTKLRRASYYTTRGFYPYGRRFFNRNFYYGVDSKGERKVNPYVHSSGGHSGGGHSCACACACACAGGGRAGCSKKDFYKGKVDINSFLEEDE